MIRSYRESDLPRLIQLTIDTFGPFYEESFRPLVGERVFAREHGEWRENYRTLVPTLHDPPSNKHVAVAIESDEIRGYVAWQVDSDRARGEIVIVAVAAERRRGGAGRALCEHAFDEMRGDGVEVVVIGSGGDAFHEAARALYTSSGCTPLPVTVFYREL